MPRKYKKYTSDEEETLKLLRKRNQRIKDAVDNVSIYNETTGGRIALARKELGLTQIQLSIQTGISQKQISEYESNKRIPTKENMDKLRKALEVDFQHNVALTEKRIERINLDHALLVLNNALGCARNCNDIDLFKQMNGGYTPEDIIPGLEYAIKRLEEENSKF